jgi:hypothetical protein
MGSTSGECSCKAHAAIWATDRWTRPPTPLEPVPPWDDGPQRGLIVLTEALLWLKFWEERP